MQVINDNKDVNLKCTNRRVNMNNLKVFDNAEFGNIRAIEIDGKPHAVGVDVARALDYANPSKAIIDHCKGITKLGIPSFNPRAFHKIF
ncbi:hypothetical protein FACS189472_18050 [Alphaproteobacteria bacterium]|nr:hypothetical protein FACS189472_18050 [Alphaproteobacteria bacterium]